jgi:hypothetical protein
VEDATLIVQQAGRISEDKGSYIDAIKLYTLAERHAQVANLLVKCLSRVCSAPTNTPERQQVDFFITPSRSMFSCLLTQWLWWFNECHWYDSWQIWLVVSYHHHQWYV